MKVKTGIYKIINNINNKIYIGSAININDRFLDHKQMLKRNKHHSKKLQNSVNKHGLENFIFEIIEECGKELLIEREQYWIDELDSYNNGYNSRPIASNMLNFVFSTESKEKMKKSHKGLQNGDKHPLYGKKHSEETKEKIRKSKIGKKLSEETKSKMSKIRKGRSSPMKGKRHSEETKEKISKNHINVNGEKNPKSKLTNVLVKEIREIWDQLQPEKSGTTYKTIMFLCEKYNMSYTPIYNVVKYKSWKEV